jgi:hypothetical protein
MSNVAAINTKIPTRIILGAAVNEALRFIPGANKVEASLWVAKRYEAHAPSARTYSTTKVGKDEIAMYDEACALARAFLQEDGYNTAEYEAPAPDATPVPVKLLKVVDDYPEQLKIALCQLIDTAYGTKTAEKAQAEATIQLLREQVDTITARAAEQDKTIQKLTKQVANLNERNADLTTRATTAEEQFETAKLTILTFVNAPMQDKLLYMDKFTAPMVEIADPGRLKFVKKVN